MKMAPPFSRSVPPSNDETVRQGENAIPSPVESHPERSRVAAQPKEIRRGRARVGASHAASFDPYLHSRYTSLHPSE